MAQHEQEQKMICLSPFITTQSYSEIRSHGANQALALYIIGAQTSLKKFGPDKILNTINSQSSCFFTDRR